MNYPDLDDNNSNQKRLDEDANADPLSIPEIAQACELFPNVMPEDMLRIYNECGKKKDILVETLLSS